MKPATRNGLVRRRRGGQKGAIAVELAVILPLFAILLIGTFELGLMAQEHQLLQNAAREGARFSALPAQQMANSPNAGSILATIQSRVIAYLANDGITVAASDIVVDQQVPIAIGPLTVLGTRVTVTYRRSILTSGSSSFFGLSSVVLQGQAVFRNFY